MSENVNENAQANPSVAVVRQPLSSSSEARRAAAVEAAYILEARTR
jgi:hypothetical protein